ncbi:lipopolysaccharide assembly protein LapB [Klebsiella quasipneumoniae subsp. similipneumoniae]|uniref:lipopolysaccharide assembly protein LapB n=1 Tax=Klebsiella TaxID=570 RepID=UPI0011DD55B8|nr:MULTISPECIES: lipopolysaccharide assembly protein LapB [Klebsiella]HBQ3043406.1 lipopolysaccharide assembly protein LapB [Klebsiella quasipneumoniae subsp. similipneumoniae]MBC3623262.1 lipopolysaccharide assembly protein LapB [Klebsiella sp. Kpp]MDK6845130.1 lipopolysaccharide assembly protein LapB [Klebsiella quasipneumoniae]MDK7892591.1 lipopolysaccharide assembly protein LapB [Klebsiella quasipneumoniae]MDK8570373.1 lipopolysaccharide assembly protein LapB [Klebsiella quasipneumoniae]
MLELLFLLLPVAAAYGWYMGRRSAQQSKQDDASRLSRDYVAGVNFLLSNQQDKAVDLFLDMLKEDTGTVEAHLTLGNLFRSRGEVDRAIRIHQSLMESASLTYDQRLLAVQQLGRDYMAAGLYDRAEDMFKQLVDETDFRLGALQQLLQIYQATSDWQSAIEVAERLVKLGKEKHRGEIANFWCELALQQMAANDLDKAMALLKKGAAADRNSARVSIMMGRVWMEKGDYAKAVESLERVIDQDKELVGETLEMLQTCYQQLGKADEWEVFLRRCVEENAGATAELMLAQILELREGVEAAQNYVTRQLERHPTMRVFHKLMDYHLNEAEEGRAKESLGVLRNMVGEQVRSKPRYRCQKCGFTAHTLYWHCPSCRSWATIKPIRGLDGQ